MLSTLFAILGPDANPGSQNRRVRLHLRHAFRGRRSSGGLVVCENPQTQPLGSAIRPFFLHVGSAFRGVELSQPERNSPLLFCLDPQHP